jgi:hypothetical protein
LEELLLQHLPPSLPRQDTAENVVMRHVKDVEVPSIASVSVKIATNGIVQVVGTRGGHAQTQNDPNPIIKV